jgi:hypothetical protein
VDLPASANEERYRKFVRDDPPPHSALQGMSLEQALSMTLKLAKAAERSWRRLDGPNQPKLIIGVRFADGIEIIKSQPQAAAA